MVWAISLNRTKILLSHIFGKIFTFKNMKLAISYQTLKNPFPRGHTSHPNFLVKIPISGKSAIF